MTRAITGDIVSKIMGKVVEDGETPIPPTYNQNRVLFNGTNNELKRIEDLNGNVNGSSGMFSCWMSVSNEGISNTIYATTSRVIEIRRDENNSFSVTMEDGLGTQLFRMSTVSDIIPSSGLVHVIASWNSISGSFRLFVNDIADIAISGQSSGTIGYTGSSHVVGARTNGSRYYNGCLSDVYFNSVERIDLSLVANRRKFIDANGGPVDLGVSGEIPTGSQPIIFLPDPFGSFGVNRGYGGDFITLGVLEECT